MKRFIYICAVSIIAFILTACSQEKINNPNLETSSQKTSDEETETEPEYVGVGVFVNEDAGDGITIYSDGTFEAYEDFENEKGKVIGTYEREGNQWRFTSPGFENGDKMGTYDGKQWLLDGEYYSYDSMSLSSMIRIPAGIYLEGVGQQSILGCRVKNLEKIGFTTEIDYENASVASGNIAEFEITYNEAKAVVKVINPFENEASLAECIVCSFYTEDTTGTFCLNNEGNCCGEENFDQLLEKDVYDYQTEKLIYKKYVIPDFDIEISTSEDVKGEKILNPSGNSDLTLNFDGAVLVSFSYVYPDLLYHGLNDNMDMESLDNMDTAAMEGVIAVRDDLLSELKEAFASAGVEINLDGVSGEIVMDNNVLFEKDSYELSDSGKEYVNQFMGVYASVLLSDKFASVVSEVRFEGHTDSSGDFGYNKILSQKRADAVLAYCLSGDASSLSQEQKDRLNDIASTIGYSYADLVYDSNGDEDADASRRVAIKFYINVGENAEM